MKYNELQSQAVSLKNIGKTLASFENRLNTIAKGMDSRDTSTAALKVHVHRAIAYEIEIDQNLSET